MIDNNLESSPYGVLVVNYHYLIPEGTPQLSGFRGVSPDIFERHLTELNRYSAPVPPNVFPLEASGRDCTRLGYFITFDDGCKVTADWALPLIKRSGARAIVFCCSQPYLDMRVLNVQKIHLLYGRWGWSLFKKKFQAVLASINEPWSTEDSSNLGLAKMYRYDNDETACFKRHLNVELPYSIVDKVLDILFESELGSQAEWVKKLYIAPDDICRCVDMGLTIGIHSHKHRMLSRLSPGDQVREIDLSLEYFRDQLGLDVDTISYPYGIAGSWDQCTKDIISDRNFCAAFTLGREIYDPAIHHDPYEIPRFDVNDVFTRDGALKQEVLG